MSKHSYTVVNGEIPAPYVDVKIRRKGGGSYNGPALVDTGSPYPLFPWDVAEAIGLERGDCLVAFESSARGTREALCAEVEIEVDSVSYKCRAGFSQRRIKDQPLLLSRAGLFRHFRVRFDQRNDMFELIPYDQK